jgi:serpin B
VTVPVQSKDITLDAGAPAMAPVSRVAAVLPANAPPTAGRRRIAAASMADLGLHLMRQSSLAAGNTKSNTVVSPYSVAVALGMLHAGAAGATAHEISGVFEPTTSAGRLLSSGLGDLPLAVKGDASSQWFAPSRVWVGQGTAKEIAPSFLTRIKATYGADGALLDFSGAPDAARVAINTWAADATQKHIAELLPPGSIKPTSKMVLTNAAYFKGQWATPLDPANTRPAAFRAETGSKDVPTMHGNVAVKEGTIDNIYVMELPFEGGNFSLLLALSPEQHTLQALENDVMGADIAAWASALKPQSVRLALPKFSIKGASQSLNDALMAAGMKSAFGNAADFSGVFKGTALTLDNVFHAAAIDVNEDGATASAATAAITVSKSLPGIEPPLRAFNRPFVFVLQHKPTGAPLFIGRVAQP